jgi:ATP-dependent DNA ligase
VVVEGRHQRLQLVEELLAPGHREGPDDTDREQLPVGVASSFTAVRRKELVDELAPLREGAIPGHPWGDWADAQAHLEGRKPGNLNRWNAQKDMSWVPLRCELVAEVRYEHMQGDRFRNVARLARFRPDRTPESCTYEQLEHVAPAELHAIVPEA